MKKLLVLLVIMFAAFACEKEEVKPPLNPIEVLGHWKLYHDVNGTITDNWLINGDTWQYSLDIHSLCQGEFHAKKNGVHFRTYRFYLNVQEDSMHFSYWTGNDPTPMLPNPGWSMYRQWDNVLLIGYQEWLK